MVAAHPAARPLFAILRIHARDDARILALSWKAKAVRNILAAEIVDVRKGVKILDRARSLSIWAMTMVSRLAVPRIRRATASGYGQRRVQPPDLAGHCARPDLDQPTGRD
jgi:hypothetical protein